MEAVAAVIGIMCGWMLGFIFHDLVERIKALELPKKQLPKEEPKSTIIEAETPEQQVMREHKERMQRMNPGMKL